MWISNSPSLSRPWSARQLDHEREARDLAPQPPDELDRAHHRPAGREQVVDDEDPLSGLDRVGVDLEGRRAVLELVLDLDRLRRQLAELAHRHEAGAELVGQRRAEDEAARLHADHEVDLRAADLLGHAVDHLAERVRLLEERGDVVEADARLREVGDLADEAAQIVDGL